MIGDASSSRCPAVRRRAPSIHLAPNAITTTLFKLFLALLLRFASGLVPTYN
jgi:hypothetical protein